MNIFRGTTEAERKTLNRRCRNGELHRVHPNTFMPTTEWSTLDATGRRRVTHLTAVDSREGMVVVGRSAALAWGLEIFDRRIADAELRSHAADPDPEVNNDIIELARSANRSTNPRRALQTVAYATQFADSAAESILRAQIIEAGLPAPEVQLRVFRAD